MRCVLDYIYYGKIIRGELEGAVSTASRYKLNLGATEWCSVCKLAFFALPDKWEAVWVEPYSKARAEQSIPSVGYTGLNVKSGRAVSRYFAANFGSASTCRFLCRVDTITVFSCWWWLIMHQPRRFFQGRVQLIMHNRSLEGEESAVYTRTRPWYCLVLEYPFDSLQHLGMESGNADLGDSSCAEEVTKQRGVRS